MRIADDLGDRAFMGEHDVGHAAEIFVEQRASTSGVEFSTSEVKPVMSVKMAATSRRCTSMPPLVAIGDKTAAICGEK